MKKIILSLSVLIQAQLWAQQSDYPVKPVPFTSVHITDNFWLPRINTNRTVTIPASFERCENTGRVKNFVMAAEKKGKFCTVFPFDDTDIYKTLEGASFSLAVYPDKKLDTYLDSLIVLIKNAQEPDGYLYTARTIDPANPHAWSGKERWVLERDNSHELYNAGHLYEAAAAHYYATGKRNLLDIALKNADLVCSVFGPGKRTVAPGHEIVEMGLVKLYRITGKQEYLNTAKFFIDARGHYKGYDAKSNDPWKNGSYWQDDKTVTNMNEVVGHAVRAMYLYSAVTDIAALTGDTAYIRSIDALWDNMVAKKIYVQGGIGAVPRGERFGDNYELPNTTAYNETCAAIGGVYWNQRMFMLHGNAKYIDVLEKMLYNGLISGIGLDGKSFFYTNAMQIHNSFSHHSMEPERSGWFECSCCPTNLTRLLPSVPGYIYAQKDDQLYVNLFISGNADLKIAGKDVKVTQQNNYPWDGDLKFTVEPKSSMAFGLRLRIPGWARGEAIPSDLYRFTGAQMMVMPEIKINGEHTEYEMQDGYAVINRKWKKNDVVELNLPMSVRKVTTLDTVKNNISKVALQRGPIIYCAEWVDNNNKTSNLVVPESTSFTTAYKADLFNGVQVLEATVPAVNIQADGLGLGTVQQKLIAIPYYTWANRGKGEMTVWFPERIKDVELLAY
ncbi:glycoside hydrolase family 127 protein [Foetidibacter luteolus]|uniref:glycoside hydrolase family 127 protein n=1 Tax=Foetidibacter luteolus TaxID=2608880 RepID=UPI00129B2DDA|nr:glycoside hydrolase family 127 protein [Foetidibacter luteolus]